MYVEVCMSVDVKPFHKVCLQSVYTHCPFDPLQCDSEGLKTPAVLTGVLHCVDVYIVSVTLL